jgi:heme-degrading monooxygenase HmoA
MIAVLFEVYPNSDASEAEYLALAAELRPHLEKIDGFLSVERFRSVLPEQPAGKILSVSFWRDEAAVVKWREFYEHQRAQATGRARLFANYRIRILSFEVIRDYGMRERAQAPQQWNDIPVL